MHRPECRFDPKRHKYFIGGSPVPSVTQVLADLIPGWRASDWHMQRGTAVHACAALVAQGKDFKADSRISGQVKAIKAFFRDVKPEVIATEAPVYSIQYRYAGTLDLLATGVGGIKRCVVDFKSAFTPSLPLQLAAYALAWGDSPFEKPVDLGIGVQLDESGTYKLSEPFSLRLYKLEFLSLLGAYSIRRRCGIKEEREDDAN